MSLAEHWIGQVPEHGAAFFAVPYRYGDEGWFDFQPLSPIYPAALWNVSRAYEDWDTLEKLRRKSPYDWRRVVAFRNKEDAGHEQPWLRFLEGDNPAYPVEILRESYGQVCRRLAQIRCDDADLTQVNIHHWQELNPVITEALVQLTTGSPQVMYNGGLLMAQVRYFDARRRRPGLPPDVAALVEEVDAARITLQLVNLSPLDRHEVIVQAGAFAQHRILQAEYSACSSPYPGPIGDYAGPELEVETRTQVIAGVRMLVHLPPATQITLNLALERDVEQPSYALPWNGMPGDDSASTEPSGNH